MKARYLCTLAISAMFFTSVLGELESKVYSLMKPVAIVDSEDPLITKVLKLHIPMNSLTKNKMTENIQITNKSLKLLNTALPSPNPDRMYEIPDDKRKNPAPLSFWRKAADVSTSSKKSYITEFLISMSKDSSSLVKSASGSKEYVDPKLTTKTKTYGDLISDSKNLEAYKNRIVLEFNEKDASYDDQDFKKYGPHSRPTSTSKQKTSSLETLDKDRFIEYLTHIGFTCDELNFLTQADLNYGFDEIEQELLKIEKKRMGKMPEIILIGVEDGMKNKGNRPTTSINTVFAILMVIAYL